MFRTRNDARPGRDLDVSFEGIAIKHLMEFPQNEFRSVDAPERMVVGMQKEGHRPLDFLREGASAQCATDGPTKDEPNMATGGC